MLSLDSWECQTLIPIFFYDYHVMDKRVGQRISEHRDRRYKSTSRLTCPDKRHL